MLETFVLMVWLGGMPGQTYGGLNKATCDHQKAELLKQHPNAVVMCWPEQVQTPTGWIQIK